MKVSQVSSAPTPTVNGDEGHSAGADRISRAKAAMTGQPIGETPTLEQAIEKSKQNLKTIKMHTQRSVNRHGDPIADTPVETEIVSTLDNVEQTQKSTEATEPMSPQYAALAKAKRALQAKEREIQVREAALKSNTTETQTVGYSKDQIKANALGILREAGVTNDDLTDAIIKESNDFGPGYSKLETEIKAMKETLDAQSKTATEQEQAVEKQVLAQVRRDVDQVVSQSDEYEAVVRAKAQDSVVKLIHTVFKNGWKDKGYEPGFMMDLEEAIKIVDDQLIEDFAPYATLKKVQSRLNPESVQQNLAKPSATKTMRTLTNRDGASPTMDKRSRAIAAMEGRLK